MLAHHALALTLVVLALAGIAAALTRARRRTGLSNKSPLRTRSAMTRNECDAYDRLQEAFPHLLVLPQISLGSFIEPTHARHRTLRNHYAQLRADFVICNTAAEPLAVVEIDDRSHEHSTARKRDARKNNACEAANLPLVRWPAIPLPSVEAIRERLTPLMTEHYWRPRK